ncbi:MAG: glycosyltransferase [Salinivirgaceae bacterium]|jgi:glycosyltransferase involved in cell wall biosynthesis|nr:glycosyltransferase [Salinivirgaceae bacterium]
MSNNKLFSIVLLSYYSSKRIPVVFQRVAEVMEKENIPFEFIVMDDGSKDDSYKTALELEKQDSRVRAYQLSRNYTSHYVKFAGFSVSRGACVTSIPDDMQQPLDTYVTMYRQWEKGNKLVIPYRTSRNDGWLKDKLAQGYYKLMNSFSEVKFPPGGFDVFLADREVVDILNERIHPINTSTTVEVLRLGFDPVFIPYDRPKVKNKSRWTFKKKLKAAADAFYTSSNFPIRLITYLGVITSIFSFGLIIFTIITKLFGKPSMLGISVPGWATTVIFISLFSGLILFSLGIIAEYIWRIYEEVKNRPGYIIKKKD